MMLLQVTESIRTGSSYFEKIQNPILGLFLLVMVVAIVVLWKSRAKKEAEIKELNKIFLEKSISDLDLFYEVEATIGEYVRQNKRLEDLAVKHQDLLKDIKVCLDLFMKK